MSDAVERKTVDGLSVEVGDTVCPDSRQGEAGSTTCDQGPRATDHAASRQCRQEAGFTTDPEIKIIRHHPSHINIADDPSLAFRVEVNLRPPELMGVAFVMLYGGSEEFVARCADRAAVDRFLDRTELREHPRVRWIKVRGPDGAVETVLDSGGWP